MQVDLGCRPKVSIITVCFNSVGTIEQAIQSVACQTYENIEYLVVDGGSTDGTLHIIKKYPQTVTKWISEPDLGIYDALNKGIKLATGDLIGIVHSDDYLEQGAVELVAGTFLNNPDADVLHGKLRLIDLHKNQEYTLRPPEDLFNSRYKTMPVWHPATFISKRCYEQLGSYDIRFKIAGDHELIMRYLTAGRKFVYVDHILTNMRVGGLSTANFVQTFRESRKIYIMYGCNPVVANFRFIKSCSKTFLVHALSRFGTFSKWYERYKEKRAA